MLTMIEAKKLGVQAAGQEFECTKSEFYGGGPTGSIGTILPELSARGKLQAVLTCTVEGCTETHIREVSDWHQSSKCASHTKAKSKGKGTGQPGRRVLKLEDGSEVVFLPVLDTDDAETRSSKEANNAVFASVKEALDAKANAEKAQRAEERKAKQEADRAEREAAKAAEKKAAIQAQLEKAKQVAAKMGVQVSPKLVAAAQE